MDMLYSRQGATSRIVSHPETARQIRTDKSPSSRRREAATKTLTIALPQHFTFCASISRGWSRKRATLVPLPSDRVLVHSAAGGIGLLLVQWIKHLGT